jgi:hypothetical protein
MTGSSLNVPHLNLAFAWLWIFFGFISGALMGMRFQNKDWMGGYTSFPRRLYRLGHISFFGLGLINFLFFITLRFLHVDSPVVPYAAWAFIVGGITMPICCLLMAHWPTLKPVAVFAAPVASLLVGGGLTLYLIAKP